MLDYLFYPFARNFPRWKMVWGMRFFFFGHITTSEETIWMLDEWISLRQTNAIYNEIVYRFNIRNHLISGCF